MKPTMEADGWRVDRENRASVRMRRDKPHGALLEDRVWTLFYRMAFGYLSSDGGARLEVGATGAAGPAAQLDAVAIDDDVAIAVECKSSAEYGKRPQFQQELGKFALVRESFTRAARVQFGPKHKRQIVLVMWMGRIRLTENDRARAAEANVLLLDERDLAYFEALVGQIGPAARYQLLAEMLPGKTVPGLALRVPAIKTKMGGHSCYTFSATPDYLLKISYVSHRAKGKVSDVTTYQRMLGRSRLRKIRDYISERGMFPTNIVVNIDSSRLNFQRSVQETEADQDSGVAGWLEIRPAYKSAWVIDGQHRLYGYSGHPMAPKSRLAVLAFAGLPPSEQAKLFIDINAKQKSVKQSLLQELYAELNWDADDERTRVSAVISRAVQDLNVEHDSPLFGRIQVAETSKDETCCISLTSIYSALEKTEFYFAKFRDGRVVQYGPLWGGTNEATLARTVFVLRSWFARVSEAVPDWWAKGAADGGGLSMNDGVITLISVLRSVFQCSDLARLSRLDNEDLSGYLEKYADALGVYLASFNDQERRAFRDLRGVQGQTKRRRHCEAAIRAALPDFSPDGLDRYLEEERSEASSRGKAVVDSIERMLLATVPAELEREMGADWWVMGVPKLVRQKVAQRYEDDDRGRGAEKNYLDLIDYQKIAMQNWEVLGPLLGFGDGGKDKRLRWLDFVNAKRNTLAHASSGRRISAEDLAQLETYESWLKRHLGSGSGLASGQGAS